MLTEVYFRGKFSLAWPMKVTPSSEPSDFSESNSSEMTMYAEFFYALSNGGSRSLHTDLFRSEEENGELP